MFPLLSIQSRLFLKNIKIYVWFPKQYLLGFFILEKQLANIPDRGFLFLRNILLLYSLSPNRRTESRTFYASRKSWIIIVFLLRTLKEKLPIFLINTLLLHIPLLALTHRRNYRETNTLAAHGLEELFSSCAVVSVFCSYGK